MITRGYFIGQIIDELTAVSHQVKNRAGLGLTDINRYLEDFFKDILNITLDYRLINLNEERSNSPGLDLGDEANNIGFQITSTKKLAKIHKTLEKALPQKEKYPKVCIFILQDKQSSYSLDDKHTKPFNFTEEDIWDINDLLKKVMSLRIEKLQTLYDLIIKEVARVKIELEIPDEKGIYQTNISSYIEKIPKESFEGITSYYNFLQSQSKDYELTQDNITQDFNNFIMTLKKLPRITRQFYAFLLERGQWEDTDRVINADYLERVCSFPDKHGELRLLTEANLCWLREPEEHGDSAFWFIFLCKNPKSNYFTYEFTIPSPPIRQPLRGFCRFRRFGKSCHRLKTPRHFCRGN